jgi:hypothetical protein
MTAFTPNFKNFFCSLACDPYRLTPEGAQQFYYLLHGKTMRGESFIDPHTGDSTIYPLSGDPVSGIGWYEGIGWPGGPESADRRLLLSSGSFTMAPGDSQEVFIAILIARGEDHIDSISELRKTSQIAQTAYDIDFKAQSFIEKPPLKAVPHDRRLTIYWEPNMESYNQVDSFLKNQGWDDSTYTFEGYRIWQFRDLEGTDPELLATYDIQNNVIEIYGRRMINGFPAEVVEIYGQNDGVRRSHMVKENRYDEKPLNNGNPYYFAVTAYAYSEHSYPTFIESEPEIIEVIPGLQKIDQTFSYDSGEKIVADHISGIGDGSVELIVVDPDALTGDEYCVIFEGEGRDLAYSFINQTTNDTLISDCTYFYIDTVEAKIYDGFMLNVLNTGQEEIWQTFADYAVRDVWEVTGPGGINLEEPVDVVEDSNSTGDWYISSYGKYGTVKQYINIDDQIGHNTYEIRFISSGSEYYLTGTQFGFSPWRGNDPKASDRVPFEIWDLGISDSQEDDVRLLIKTMDEYRNLVDDSVRVDEDGKWSKLDNGDWEPIFAFFQDSIYQEPLSESSGRITNVEDSRLGKIIIHGELPEEGTVIRITTWKPLTEEDIFSVTTIAPNTKDFASAKTSLEDISVFPNPYFGFGTLSGYIKQDFVRFTNLPTQVTLRIFSLAGIYVRQIEKNDENPWLDWDLKNNSGEQVASGVYIAHLEMPNIGEKVMKIAVILENQR